MHALLSYCNDLLCQTLGTMPHVQTVKYARVLEFSLVCFRKKKRN